MLDKTNSPNRQILIDDRRLWHLTPCQRGRLAVNLIKGDNLTAKAAAAACRVSLSTVYRELARRESVRLLREETAPKLTRKEIVSWWSSASFADQVALVHELGPASTWDALAAVVDTPPESKVIASTVEITDITELTA